MERRLTRSVQIGSIAIGGDNPIAVQTMITKQTRDVAAATNQVINLYRAGAEIIRLTVPTLKDVESVAQIRANILNFGLKVPLVADVHHQGSQIAIQVAPFVDKVRINPGLFVDHGQFEEKIGEYTQSQIDERIDQIEKTLKPVISSCQEYGTAIRVGVNHGSLSNRMKVLYGDTPAGMVESAIEYLKILERNNFYNTVVSLKASKVPIMVASNLLMVERMIEEGMTYPLHLGVTEAGFGELAVTKSVVGLTRLLMNGIGDTIRISLTDDSKKEVEVGRKLLQDLELIEGDKGDFISCPGCGRTKFDIQVVAPEIKAATSHLKDLNIAVMGCVVNGPGEVRASDYGYVGEAGGRISLYRKKNIVKRGIPQEKGLVELVALLEADGVWFEAPAD